MNNRDDKKVLFVATIDGHILSFHLPYLKWFQENGYQTFVAANGNEDIPYCDVKINLCIQRSPFSLQNIRAYRELKPLIGKNNFRLIHGHTPVGGVLTRLSGRKFRKNGLTVLYTAHGFHFYRGGSKLSWMIFYPIEKYLSKITDGLITINTEDFEIAKNKFHARRTFLFGGVGYDETRFFIRNPMDRNDYRQQMGYSQNEILLIYVAELSKRKNQGLLLNVLKKLREQHLNVRLLLVGGDALNGAYQTMAKELDLEDAVDFLGLRNDVDRLIPMCDIVVASALNEGQGINILEAMACGVPVVATTTKGHRDLIENGEGGFLIPWKNIQSGFVEKIRELISDKELYKKIEAGGLKTAERYTKQRSLEQMIEIYNEFGVV
jgi:glycosyltransferase EpsD